MPNRDLGHAARRRAEMLDVVADNLAGPWRQAVLDGATLLREMAEERERLRTALAEIIEVADDSHEGIEAGSCCSCSQYHRIAGLARAALREQGGS